MVCSSTGQSKGKRVAFLNSAVQALQLIYKSDKKEQLTSHLDQKHIPDATDATKNLRKNGDSSVNKYEKGKDEDSSFVTPKKDCKGIISSLATPDQAIICRKTSADYTRLFDEESSCSSILGDVSQRTDDNGLDFREEKFSMQECYSMLRCCLVNDSQEVRGAGLRFVRYLTESQSDAKALCSAGLVPLIIRCLDRVGSTSAAERIQALRLIRKLLQLTSLCPFLSIPCSIVHCVVSLCRAGLQYKDNFYYSALALLTEMMLSHPNECISSGAAAALQDNVLECGNVPRIHEAIMGSLLRLVNSPEHRHHTVHMMQVIAPFTDYHYRHTSYELENVSLSVEREQRLTAAKLSILVLLRSWPGLFMMSKDNLAPLRSITAQLAHSPHHAITKAIINVLYEIFSIEESKYFKRESSDSEGWTTNPAFDDTHKLQGGSFENQEWEDVVSAHLNTPSGDPDSWSLYEGFVAMEAKESLPNLARFKPNLTQAHQALVLYCFIKADLFGALCHAIINSPMTLAMRATLLLGELGHRALQDLPPECSQLVHALPELMNQAATNYSLVNSSSGSLNFEKSTTNKKDVFSAADIYSSNPVINIELNSQTFEFNPLEEKTKRDSISSDGVNAPDRNSKTFSVDQQSSNQAKSNLHSSSYNLFSKLFSQDLVPTNPFSIPTHTNITNAATAQLKETQRKARALLAINALLKLSRGRLNPPSLPPQHSLFLAHMLHALPNASLPITFSEQHRGGIGETCLKLHQIYTKKNLSIYSRNDLSKMSRVR